eukprot:CAMPEP_0178428866 /NCGR_PEP_ID=MMETSP0689_2-20121128/30505_1 /TAXON_ID=160604 /ORGANISM="Amphidinium massartii, Strain CS-259" /LENGTH=270 /DNA_ID=CAMNT_0020050665 /DNA_START=159 /DNA_END=971 /DNA_ORIENTATION=-
MRKGQNQFYADIRGVTVRNTFLDFHDDCAQVDTGFMRQCSAPVAFKRQESEQTTAGSGGSGTGFEESSDDFGEGGYAMMSPPLDPGMMAAFQNCGIPMPMMPSHGPGSAPKPASQWTMPMCGGAQGAPPMVPEESPHMPSMGGVTQCPQCGAQTQPGHRFCPFCCYQLIGGAPAPATAAFLNMSSGGRQMQGGGGGGCWQPGSAAASVGHFQMTSQVPDNNGGASGSNGMAAQGGTCFLSSLSAVPYVESPMADVERMRVMLANRVTAKA